MASHSGSLVWEIPWKEKSGGHSTWGHKRVGYDSVTENSNKLPFVVA